MDTSDFLILIAIILVGATIVYPVVRDSLFHARANREGVIVDATVIRKRMNSGRIRANCSLEYKYLDYERLEFVKRQGYEAVDEGDQIKIVYLSSNPQDARIIDTRVKGT